ncbi:Extracellular sulfatase SULF-1 [Seminavis robusta]|uniref:Extracellular sulfatase SULF-1 n=1 Tax=Seminavis robusta TaxID=568900 RepID=A0A9N8HJM4_9STRA|nr:Extracellular sulfatase SULF-1 [Seminavis robusta]|eukprot:Sro871_g213820.1 Extracellular sulfatase SULF-1 (629) ;mRNA; r:24022-26118
MDRPLLGDSGNGGRRINQKAYIFFFGLIFTATLSIYRSSYFSTSDGTDASGIIPLQGQGELQVEFAPSRLDTSAIAKTSVTTTGTTSDTPDTPDFSAQQREIDQVNEKLKLKLKSDKDNGKDNGTKKSVDSEPKKKANEKVEDKDSNNHNKPQDTASSSSSSSSAKPQEESQEQEQSTTSKEPEEEKKPMNVVILYADDWRHDSLGVAGTLPVHTPFLDWLSRTKGIRFTHNCVTTSVCWISRATLHTGQYYSRHQATRPRDNGWYDMWHDTYPSLLKHKRDYWVSHIGKWHSADWGKVKGTYDHQKVYYGKHWFPGNPRPIHVTERNENDAIEALKKRPKEKPFVLTVAFFAPHSWDGNPEQFLPQNKSLSLYQNITLRAPVDMDASYKRLPRKVISERNEGRTRWRQRFDEPTKYDKMLKNYFRLISEVDGACQKVWDELEAQGILNNTLFVFTTDNGFYHGEHGLAGKWYPHEESIRVPLIIYDPRMPTEKQGTTDDSFTLNIDLAPTILGAANIDVPETYQGRDISDLYLPQKSATPPWRTEFFYEHPIHLHQNVIPASSALVRKDIKYIQWPNWGVEQLFNLTSDPMEENDVILDPNYAGLHGELKARHDTLRDLVAKEKTKF